MVRAHAFFEGLLCLGLAFAAGADILAEQALLDQVQALHGQTGDHPLRCGTPLIVEALHTIQNPTLPRLAAPAGPWP